MKEYELEALEQYDIEVKNVKRGRAGFLLDTDKGLMLLVGTRMSERKAGILYKVHEHLQENGYLNVDALIPNREGELVSRLEDGASYMVKRWFAGRECNVRKDYEVTEAVKNLAFLHNILAQPPEMEAESMPVGSVLWKEFARRNQKLKKVRTFIRKRAGKTEFEMTFLKYFDRMYDVAESVTEQAKGDVFRKLYEETCEKRTIVHGDYNYHNVCMLPDGMATVNFENFGVDVRPRDLYYFMRKILEKNRWDAHLGEQIVRSYRRIHPLKDEEMNYLALRLAYPEKFFKAANTYCQSNKAKIPEKSVEKLVLAVQETERKKQFLTDIFTFHL